MRNIIKGILISLLAIFYIGCEKEEVNKDVSAVDAIEALTEYSEVSKIFQDVGNNGGDALNNAQSAAESGTLKSSLIGSVEVPDISVEPFDLTTFPKTTTVDFKEGILCVDGVTRKGKMQIVSTDWYGVANSIHTTTFDNYYHNGYKVEGTHVVTNLGENEDGNLRFSVLIEDGAIVAETGDRINYKENSYRTWIAGNDTPLYIWDDEYLLDGTQSGTTSKNIDYTLEVQESLHFTLLPRAIIKGLLSVKIGTFEDVLIDYNNSTITVLGQSYPF